MCRGLPYNFRYFLRSIPNNYVDYNEGKEETLAVQRLYRGRIIRLRRKIYLNQTSSLAFSPTATQLRDLVLLKQPELFKLLNQSSDLAVP